MFAINQDKKYLLIENVIRMVPLVSDNFAKPTENGISART